MSCEQALVFDGVTVRYGPDTAPVLADVAFSLAARERAALVGLNGSGKTTLLMAAVGLIGHEGGIRVCGTPVAKRTAAEVRGKVGFLFNVPEDQLLFPKVIEDAAFGLLRRGEARTEAYRRAAEALGDFGVGRLAEWPLHNLSHGQKQRVALAGALVTKPPLLLLDEPSAGLDPPGRLALARLLDRLDAAMLVATHDLDFAVRFCHRFIALDAGRIVYDGGDASTVRRTWGMEE
ncbi:MAG: ABC transporter ATP-binding protein [Acidobacteria bacterium]|nr:ABC transporter ATP-binding protein [Acidobacteriota bacterium]